MLPTLDVAPHRWKPRGGDAGSLAFDLSSKQFEAICMFSSEPLDQHVFIDFTGAPGVLVSADLARSSHSAVRVAWIKLTGNAFVLVENLGVNYVEGGART